MDIGRATGKLFAARTISYAISLLIIILFADLIGAEGLGIFFLFQTLAGVLSIVVRLGINGATEKRISGNWNKNEVHSTGLAIKSIPYIVIGGSIIILQPQIEEFVGLKVALPLLVTVIMEDLVGFYTKILNAEHRVGETAILEIIHQTIFISAAFLFWEVDYGPFALIYGYMLAVFARLVYVVRINSFSYHPPTLRSSKALIKYAKFDTISGSGWKIFTWLDVLLVGLFLSQRHVGAYELVWRISTTTTLLLSSINTSIFPQISTWDSKEKYSEISRLISDYFPATLLLSVGAFFGSLVVGKEILRIYFGSEFTIAYFALCIVMFQRIIQGPSELYARTLQAIGEEDIVAYAMVFGVLSNGILNIILIPRLGITGAAIATTASYMLMSLIRANYVNDHIGLRLETFELLSYAIASGLMIIGLLLLKSQLAITAINLTGIILIGGIIYLSSVMLSPIGNKIKSNVI
ncbi:oligosaccharide flippase family protein [Haloarchaeobius sp. DYHT-AS-18]|uniref:oligosaccharide flippase family protein n=1 Tax=Haloarchaeobius sp. DYHT-AS-18 TaxID=3446117 RepID=UPI003EBC99F9